MLTFVVLEIAISMLLGFARGYTVREWVCVGTRARKATSCPPLSAADSRCRAASVREPAFRRQSVAHGSARLVRALNVLNKAVDISPLPARVSNFVQTVRPIRRSLRSYGDVATQGVP